MLKNAYLLEAIWENNSLNFITTIIMIQTPCLIYFFHIYSIFRYISYFHVDIIIKIKYDQGNLRRKELILTQGYKGIMVPFRLGGMVTSNTQFKMWAFTCLLQTWNKKNQTGRSSTSVFNIKTFLEWHTSSSEGVSPKPPQIAPPIENQLFNYLSNSRVGDILI